MPSTASTPQDNGNRNRRVDRWWFRGVVLIFLTAFVAEAIATWKNSITLSNDIYHLKENFEKLDEKVDKLIDRLIWSPTNGPRRG